MIIITERESLSIMTKSRTHKRKELVNLKTQAWRAAISVGWGLMTQNTVKSNHFNIEIVSINAEENPHSLKGKLEEDIRR